LQSPDGFRKESFSVVAYDGAEAIREAKNSFFGREPSYFHVRAVTRKSVNVIYKSNATG
jgi:hypothetical protein